jgi:hypothetical protein
MGKNRRGVTRRRMSFSVTRRPALMLDASFLYGPAAN